jgi:hypothetical protein
VLRKSKINNYSGCQKYVPNNVKNATSKNPLGPLYKGGTKYQKLWPKPSIDGKKWLPVKTVPPFVKGDRGI